MKKKETFILRTIGGSNVMIPVGATALKFNGLITANESDAFVWKNIEKVSSAEELAQLLCQEFDVSHEKALADCQNIIDEMIKAGWIE